jgi:hypothetical protein
MLCLGFALFLVTSYFCNISRYVANVYALCLIASHWTSLPQISDRRLADVHIAVTLLTDIHQNKQTIPFRPVNVELQPLFTQLHLLDEISLVFNPFDHLFVPLDQLLLQVQVYYNSECR